MKRFYERVWTANVLTASESQTIRVKNDDTSGLGVYFDLDGTDPDINIKVKPSFDTDVDFVNTAHEDDYHEILASSASSFANAVDGRNGVAIALLSPLETHGAGSPSEAENVNPHVNAAVQLAPFMDVVITNLHVSESVTVDLWVVKQKDRY